MAMVPADISTTHQDDSGLARLLHRFALQQSLSYGVPIKPDSDGRNVLRVLLEEVDETMLPRQLTLNCQPAGIVRVLASNRRMSGIEIVGSPKADQSAAPTGPAELANHYASTLSQIFAHCSEVTLLPPERIENLQSSDCSCSAQLVAEAARLDCFTSDNTQSFDGFFSALKDVAEAWVEFGSDHAQSGAGGPPEHVDHLSTTFRKFRELASLPSGKTKFRSSAPEFICAPLTDNDALIACSRQKGWFLAIVPADQIEELSTQWHSCRE